MNERVNETTDLAALAAELSWTAVRFARHLRLRNSKATVSLTQRSALITLSEYGRMTLGELSTRERVRPPSTTRVVQSLAELGLVERAPDPLDGRQVLIELTPAGTAFVADDMDNREEWLATRIGALPPEQQATLVQAAKILEELTDDEDVQS